MLILILVRFYIIFSVFLLVTCASALEPYGTPPDLDTCITTSPAPNLSSTSRTTAEAKDKKGLCEASVNPASQLPLYTVVPANIGATLNPLGASVVFALTSEQYPITVRLLTTIGYDRGLASAGNMYGFLRYEFDAQPVDTTSPAPVVYSLQAGMWPYDPHRTQTHRTAYGVKWGVQAPLFQRPVSARVQFDVGLIGLLETSSVLSLDSRGDFIVANGTTDRWGYRVSGWQGTLSGLWSATGAAPSLALWVDGAYTHAAWPLDLGLRVGYRPVWPVPIPTSAEGELGVLGTIGTHARLLTPLTIGNGLAELQRVTLEPRLRLWSDTSFGVGADITLSLDTIIDQSKFVSLGGTVGYAGQLWTRLSLRVQP